MANEQIVAMLRRDPQEFNQWREDNPEASIDLLEADLRGVNLAGADLSAQDLEGADLRGAISIPSDAMPHYMKQLSESVSSFMGGHGS